jgi:hypothetical protein
VAAAEGLRFPVVVKPNIGGSGAGVRRFETVQALEAAAQAGALDLGVDQTALVQEFIPADQQRIVRVEVLGGRFLYAIRIYTPGDSFNLCPADVCQTVGGVEYLIDARDGARYYYDVNALSNFVADAPRVVGFDPFARLVDYLEKRGA